jgi:hypothetical protein
MILTGSTVSFRLKKDLNIRLIFLLILMLIELGVVFKKFSTNTNLFSKMVVLIYQWIFHSLINCFILSNKVTKVQLTVMKSS